MVEGKEGKFSHYSMMANYTKFITVWYDLILNSGFQFSQALLSKQLIAALQDLFKFVQ